MVEPTHFYHREPTVPNQEKLFADARAQLKEELNVFVVNTLGSSCQVQLRGGLMSGGQVGPRMMYIYIFIPWNPKWRFGRWFSSSVGWFLGSMLILRGVYENITFMSSVWNIAVWVGKDTRWGSRSFVEKNMSTKANILKAIHVPWASCDWWLHVWKIERIDQHQNWQVHVQWCVSNPKDPWDERYIYLHESLIFFW